MDAKDDSELALFSYPVLQAADILLYGSTHVPVGEDQVQHLEFARECARKFNHVYGDIFQRPKTVFSPARRIMSLKEPLLKMSKSHADPRSRILVNDDHQTISEKLRFALTDSMARISYDPINRPGVSNLLTIMSCFDDQRRTTKELALTCSDMSMREFKAEITTIISNGMADVRNKYNRLMHPDHAVYLHEIAATGRDKARLRAMRTMDVVRQALRLGIPALPNH
ncbi:Tryptophan--tRNA ligase, mitochondrial [Puttea exsequens]|nr:Tryptophan--tRNA ligase, mitochondrial [Puttea exsequens]